MRHAWKAYRTYAWGYDELHPISKSPSPWFGVGLTIVDSIDTLYIMNMTEGFYLYIIVIVYSYKNKFKLFRIQGSS